MTDKSLKRLSRADLLELLIDREKEIESLRERLERAERQLESREILLRESGSIAEAALRLNGIFETAQAAADQYLDNVKRLCGESMADEREESDARED